jgi:hypothetical protein
MRELYAATEAIFRGGRGSDPAASARRHQESVAAEARTALVQADPAALGWAPTREEADAVVASIRDSITAQAFMPMMGRLMPPQQPTAPDPGADPTQLTAMSVAALANIWPLTVPTYYEGYLVLDEPPAGLETIESIPVITDASLNWLNVFYAIEWVVFAGFAFFLWYRLVRDAFHREIEEESSDEGLVLQN